MGCKECWQKIPTRYIIMAMIFISSYVNYITQCITSISVPAMVKSTGVKFTPECLKNEISLDNSTASSLDEYTGEKYDWSERIQGLIFGAYFYGFAISSLPAGFVSEWVGPFWTIFITTAATAVLNSLCPWVTSIHWAVLFAFRFLIGVCGGFIFPALQCLIGRWAPPQERTKFVGCLMGNSFGICLTWLISGGIIRDYTWPWSFHVLTFQILVYLVIFSLLTYDSPEQHKWITEEELNYIKESQAGKVSKTKSVPPFKAMFTSFPFWTLVICHFGNLYGFQLQISGVPKFLKEYIGVDIKDAGLLSSLPNLLRTFLGIGFGVLSDWLKKKQVRRVVILKSFIVLCTIHHTGGFDNLHTEYLTADMAAHIVPGIFMGLMIVAGCHTPAAVAFLVISSCINGSAVVTTLSNPTDLSPNFAGTIFGTMTFITSATGFIVPSTTGAFIHAFGNNGKAWGFVFALCGIIYCLTGVFFIIFGSADTQPWNEKNDETDK